MEDIDSKNKTISTFSNEIKKLNKKHLLNLLIYTNLGPFLYGYDFGAVSWLLIAIKKNSDNNAEWLSIVSDSEWLQGFITACTALGAFISCLYIFSNKSIELGRKTELIIAACCLCMGNLLQGLSGDTTWNSSLGLFILIFGRLIFGLGVGFSMHAVPPYITEISPPNIRGFLGSIEELMVILGMILGYSIGAWMSIYTVGWKYTFFTGAVIALLMIFGLMTLPSSPRWLIFHKSPLEKVLSSLQWISPQADMSNVEELHEQIQRETEGEENFWQRVTSPALKLSLMIAVGLVTFQQLSGQPTLLYYAGVIIDDAAYGDIAAGLVGLAIFKLIGIITVMAHIEDYGRRYLLLLGTIQMFFGILMLCILFSSDNTDWPILLFFYLFSFGYELGLGPITWVLLGEIFPLSIRSEAISLALIINFGWSTIITIITAVAITNISYGALFGVFTFLCLLAILFVYMFVPETKGMKLEEINSKIFAEHENLPLLNETKENNNKR